MAEFNAAFRKWFGDSKVVDKKGNPLIVYHATDKRFDKFDIARCEFGCHFGNHAQAMSIANNLGKNHEALGSYYLSIQNPLRLSDEGLWSSKIVTGQLLGKRLLGKSDVDEYGRIMIGSYPYEQEASIVARYIKKLGYDGIVYLNRAEGLSPIDNMKTMEWDNEEMGGIEVLYNEFSDAEYKKLFSSARDSYIVFKPSQIKAIDNDGTWDMDDDNIRSNPKRRIR